jgi:hypothetical protein
MPVNADELEVCKQRGHDAGSFLDQGWCQCKWCGLWLREIRTIEEREDAPPDHERSPLFRMRNQARTDPHL